MDSDTYTSIGLIVGVISFFGIWVAAFTNWGFLVGLAIGWLPAAIGGAIVGFGWPIALPIAIIFLLSTNA